MDAVEQVTRYEDMTGDSGEKSPAGGRAGVKTQLVAAVPGLLDEPVQKRLPIACPTRLREVPAEGFRNTGVGDSPRQGFAFKRRRRLFTIDSY